MSGGFPGGLDYCNAQDVGWTSANGGTAVVTGTSNAAGSWTQFIASTSYDIDWLEVSYSAPVGLGQDGLIDVGVGSAGNEVVAVNKLSNYCGGNAANYSFPLSIASGSRVSLRSYGGTGQSIYAKICGYSSSFSSQLGAAGVDALNIAGGGANVGTALTSGTNGAWGSYAQIIASTTRDYIGLMATIDYGSSTTKPISLVVAIGGAGSEVPIVGSSMTVFNSAPASGVIPPLFRPVNIPAGTRISAKLSSAGMTSYSTYAQVFGIYQ